LAGVEARWIIIPVEEQAIAQGTGFEQPLQLHQHWHIGISYINLSVTFYHLCSILDGFSRFLVHWDLRESIRDTDVDCMLGLAAVLILHCRLTKRIAALP